MDYAFVLLGCDPKECSHPASLLRFLLTVNKQRLEYLISQCRLAKAIAIGDENGFQGLLSKWPLERQEPGRGGPNEVLSVRSVHNLPADQQFFDLCSECYVPIGSPNLVQPVVWLSPNALPHLAWHASRGKANVIAYPDKIIFAANVKGEPLVSTLSIFSFPLYSSDLVRLLDWLGKDESSIPQPVRKES